MKKTILFLFASLLLTAVGVQAQQVNKLYAGNVRCMKSMSVDMPFYLDNTSPDVVAVQFDVSMPEGTSLGTSSSAFTMDANRVPDHQPRIVSLGSNKYRVMVLSPTNSPFRANKGKLFSLTTTVATDANLQVDETYPVTISHVVIGDSLGRNVMTDYADGSLTLAPSPDFTVSDVRLTAVADVTGATAMSPGNTFTLEWTVNNIGSADSEAGWREQIFFVKPVTGERCHIATSRHVSERLASGASLNISESFTVPRIPGMDGQFKVQIELVPSSQSGEHSEYQNNNTTLSSSNYSLGKRLYLSLQQSDIIEPGNDGSVSYYATLERSGSREQEQSFSVSLAPADSRLESSETVTIAQGKSSASFSFLVKDDHQLNGDTIDFTFTVPASANYQAVSVTGHLIDDEHPDLQVSLSKNEIDEGDELTLTVTATRAPKTKLTVQLSNDAPSRFKMPSKVTIPAGATTATATLKAYDDNVVADMVAVRFTASAANYNSGYADALLSDNDMPQISLKFSTNTVSEGAGANAVAVTLSRDKTNSPLTVEMTSSDPKRVYSSYQRFTIPKGQRQFQFYLHVVDNWQVDGDQEVTISAEAFITSCSCKTNGKVGGVAERILTIVDDDGPALSLTTKNPNILEGSTGNVFTVKRNDESTSDLTVKLSTRDDNTDIHFPATVTIPAGKSSTTFEASLDRNSVSNDSRTITLVAKASGYSQGTCWVMATDQTLPDATIDMSIETENVYATIPAVLNLVVHNYGYASLPEKTPVSIVANGSVVETIYTSGKLKHGEVSVMPITMTAVLSNKPGNIPVYAVVNSGGVKSEINYSNNTSLQETVTVLPLLKAISVVTDKESYGSEETVRISGETEGLLNREADIEVYIRQGGTRITIPAKTDEEGRFAVEWTPSLGMAGQFGVGACMPDEQLTNEWTSFYLYGMRRASGTFLTNEMRVGETQNGYIDIVNPGTQILTNLRASVSGLPDNVTLTFDNIASLAPGQSKSMAYHITGQAVSPSFKEWQTCQLRITSAEDAVMLQTLNFVVYPNVPQLKATVSSISTTMIKDALRSYEFTIYNEGRLETGEITVDVGDTQWLTTATPRRMASLAPGEDATVVLQMHPTPDIELNSVLQGTIFVSAANGSGVSIPMSVQCVSEKTGTLVIDVWDEFTANTAEAPHVGGATVAVLHPVTQKLLRQYVTGDDGLATFENLAEGKYIVEVTHPRHVSYLETVIVSPARTTTQRAFISYNAISIEMVYEPTEVEDVYDIVTTVNYETQVPAPVLKMDMPERLMVKELQTPYIYYVTLTNVGLITAKDVEFVTQTEWDEYRFTPLIEGPWQIMPQQSVIIPVEITKLSDGTADARGAWPRRNKIDDAGIQCALGAMSKYKGSCAGLANADGTQEYMVKQLMQVNDGCAGISDLVNVIDRVLGSVGFSPSGGWKADTPKGGGTFSSKTPNGVARVSCDPCLYDNAPDDIQALADMRSGDKQDIASSAAQMIAECYPNLPPPPSWPGLEGFGSRQMRNESSPVVYDTRPAGMSTATLMDCYREIVKVITPVEESVIEIPGLVNVTNAQVEIPSWLPSYMRAWLVNTGIAHDLNYHDMGYVLYVTGNTEWPLIESAEAKALVAAFQATTAPTGEQLEKLRPAALDDEQFAAVVSRLSGFDNDDFTLLAQLADRVQSDLMEINRRGYPNALDLCVAEGEKTIEALNTQQTSACASVKLQMSQQLTMTRQAVRGTLTVVNAAQNDAMRDVKLNLVVTDPDGNVATSHIMEIHTESLEGFTGDLDYESGWTLAAGTTGEAKIIFIPTKYAAPTEPLQYTFGGTISFVDPYTGQEMTRELETERLTVAPSPNLELTYFMQRDILGDDPLTEEVEPMIPSQFSLLINNKGYGDATKVKMVTNQPEVIDNEKGLLASYEIVSSQLNGGAKTLALGSSVATDFGTIPAHSQAYAQWWLTSSLTGHFTDYSVEATHVTSYDNPDLTLLDTVTIHELIHQIVIPQNDQTANTPSTQAPPLIGFMANDEEDVDDTADQLYMSNGTKWPIHSVASAVAVRKGSDMEYTVTAAVANAGWNYGKLADPTGGSRKLLTVRRQSDGVLLPAENFWQTDRTLRDGLQPLYESLLHFCDEMPVGGESYIVTFEDKPAVALEVRSVSGIPSSGSFTRDAVTEVVVTFNKPVNAASFTSDDLVLMHEGEIVDVSGVTVGPVDVGNETTFKINLSSVTNLNGYYFLDIQTNGITDLEGFHGESGRKCSWIQLSDGKVNLTMKVTPEGAGTVSPGTSLQDFDGTVGLFALPADGYTFGRWVKDEKIISEEPGFVYQMQGAATITAVFNPRQYKLVVNYDQDAGILEGGSGLYDYNQTVTLKATAKQGYYFVGWKHEDKIVSTDETLVLTINKADSYEAVFELIQVVQANLSETKSKAENIAFFQNPRGERYMVTLDRKLSQNQWNTFCVPFDISEQQINKTWGYNTMLVRLKSVEDETLNFEYAWNIKAGVPYLVKPERTVESPELYYDGNLVLAPEPLPDTFGEYSFVGIYSPYAWTNIGQEYYYGVSSGKLIKAKSTTSALNGLRAYFVLPPDANARVNIGGIETVIDEVFAGDVMRGDGRIYNLQGQYLGTSSRHLPAGIYIINGKKQVVR